MTTKLIRNTVLAALVAASCSTSAFFPHENPAARPGCVLQVLWRTQDPTTVALLYRDDIYGPDPVQCKATELAAMSAAVAQLAAARLKSDD